MPKRLDFQFGTFLVTFFYIPVYVSFFSFWFCPILFISSSRPLFSHSLLPPRTQPHPHFLAPMQQWRQSQWFDTKSAAAKSDFIFDQAALNNALGITTTPRPRPILGL